MKITRKKESQIKKELMEQRLQKTLEKYPELEKEKTAMIKKFSEIIYAYPDLKDLFNIEGSLDFAIIIKTGELRELYRGKYRIDWMSEMASARGLRFGKEETYNFPAFEFLKECVICEKKEIGINLCPNCWGKLRTALEIKTDQSRPGWNGWGYECNCLNLDEVAKLLGLKKKPLEIQKELKK